VGGDGGVEDDVEAQVAVEREGLPAGLDVGVVVRAVEAVRGDEVEGVEEPLEIAQDGPGVAGFQEVQLVVRVGEPVRQIDGGGDGGGACRLGIIRRASPVGQGV